MKTSHVNLWCDGDCWIVGKTNREMFWWVPLIFSVPFERSVLHDDRITDGVSLALVSGCVWSLKIGFIFLWSKRSFPDKVHDPQDKSLSLSLAEWSPFRRRTRVQVCFIILKKIPKWPFHPDNNAFSAEWVWVCHDVPVMDGSHACFGLLVTFQHRRSDVGCGCLRSQCSPESLWAGPRWTWTPNTRVLLFPQTCPLWPGDICWFTSYASKTEQHKNNSVLTCSSVCM